MACHKAAVQHSVSLGRHRHGTPLSVSLVALRQRHPLVLQDTQQDLVMPLSVNPVAPPPAPLLNEAARMQVLRHSYIMMYERVCSSP